jgi:hypothetical protein
MVLIISFLNISNCSVFFCAFTAFATALLYVKIKLPFKLSRTFYNTGGQNNTLKDKFYKTIFKTRVRLAARLSSAL